jgi:cell division septum initiation protein DivIVA
MSSTFPTKTEEIAILQTAVTQLGRHSYCGPWLESQLPVIASEISSDLTVTADFRAARRESEALIEAAKANAAEIVARAERDAARLRDEANREVAEIFRAARAQLTTLASRLDR